MGHIVRIEAGEPNKQGQTVYVIQEQAGYLYLDQHGEFTVSDRNDENIMPFLSMNDARICLAAHHDWDLEAVVTV